MDFSPSEPPLQKISSITKSLRARDSPLLSLLATARSLEPSCPSSETVYFPRRTEWLLEWLAQRLREDEGEAGRAARTSRECWAFLAELMERVGVEVAGMVVKRHGVVGVVARVMGEEEEEGAGGVVVAEVARVLELVPAAVRPSAEVAAGVLGGFWRVCGGGVEERWVRAFVGLWRASVWGSANAKKVAGVWAEKCLAPAAELLVMPELEESLRTLLEEMIAEYVFAPEIIFPAHPGQKQSTVKPSKEGLAPLLAPLKQEDTVMAETPENGNIQYLPLLLRIAIRSLSKKRGIDVATVEVLFTALLNVVPNIDFESEAPDVTAASGDIIASLLQVLVETGTALSSATLSRIVTKSANLASADREHVRWSLIETVLAIDFDTFLHPSVATLTSELFTALSNAKPDEQVSQVLHLVLDGFVKARDVMGFVERWTAQLKRGSDDDVWRSDALAGAFAMIVEGSLTSPQIVKIVNSLCQDKQWIVLDAMLRGLRREETETRLLASGSLEAVVESARNDSGEWRAWRLLVRIGTIKPELLAPAVGDAVWLVRADDKWKEAVFAAEVLMHIAESLENADDEGALEGARMALDLAVESLRKPPQVWDGRVTGIYESNFGLAVAMAVVGGHMGILEKVGAGHRNKFVDSLVHAALAAEMDQASVNARQICQVMLGRSEFYEYFAVKETMLSALTSSLAALSITTGDMSTAISNPPNVTPENIPRYEFLLSCLQKYPLEAMKRTAREKTLDICLLLDISGCLLARPLMNKLWRVGNADSSMARNPQAIKQWFIHPNAAHIFRRLLGHAFSNRDQEKTRDYLTKLLAMVHSIVRGAKKGAKLSAGELELTWVVITGFWKFRNEESINVGTLEKMRKRFLEYLAGFLNTRKHLDPDELKYWREVWELERDEKAAASKFAARVAGKITNKWDKGSIHVRRVVESFGVLCSIAESADDVMNVTAFAVVAKGRLKGEGEADVLRHYKSTIGRLDIPTHREVTERVVSACFSDEVGDGIWELFKTLVSAIKKPDTPEELSASITTFSAVHSRLILSLPSSRSPSAFILTADCIDLLLRENPWSTIQHNLDTTLSSLSLCASARGPPLAAALPSTIYASLTRILSSILALHRHRIRGRYHLVVALLQQLLTLLFLPRLSRRKVERALHPPWLLPPHPPLDVLSARAFARALQTFCDPPVSSVRSHRSELTDSERGKERKMVAATVGPVLECFVKRVLEERVEGDVRRELGGGIEKVLAVLGTDGVRSATGGMGGEGRAVVKGLWVEFGRGRGEKV